MQHGRFKLFWQRAWFPICKRHTVIALNKEVTMVRSNVPAASRHSRSSNNQLIKHVDFTNLEATRKVGTGKGSSSLDLPRIERAVREIMIAIGEDPDREGLRKNSKSHRPCLRGVDRRTANRSVRLPQDVFP